jgi:geranylgeranyl pyrophosphate synthase
MNIITQIQTLQRLTKRSGTPEPWAMLEDELAEALALYWSTANKILRGSGVRLLDPSAGYFLLENNFFSVLFLYSYHRRGIARSRRIFYTAINQCLRGMVTGCDNILDDEYKKTLETDLPEEGVRFRSIVDIMVSDRVLFEILFDGLRDEKLNGRQVLAASAASLGTLVQSGAQEASEEGGIQRVLEPQQILQSVHHYKTGLLFRCPWAIPLIIENVHPTTVDFLQEALYNIGMGCQIMDDMVDLTSDFRNKRHNYVLALIYHDSDPGEWARLESRLAKSNPLRKPQPDLLRQFPRAQTAARKTARRFLNKGLRGLLDERHHFMVDSAMSFLAERIGSHRMMADKQ